MSSDVFSSMIEVLSCFQELSESKMSTTLALWIWCCWCSDARSKLSIPHYMWHILLPMPVSFTSTRNLGHGLSTDPCAILEKDRNNFSYMPTKIFKNRRKITFQGCRQVSSNPKVCSYPKECIIKTTNCIESAYYPRSFAKCQPTQCK